MKTKIINGNLVTSKGDFHIIIKTILGLPDYYGKNLDALWDCLSAWIDLPIKIIWNDFAISKLYLGEYIDEIVNLFNAAQKEIVGFYIEYH